MRTLTPPQTLPECQRRSSFSLTLRTIHPSLEGAGPGDSAPSSFLVSCGGPVRLSWGKGSTGLCSRGKGEGCWASSFSSPKVVGFRHVSLKRCEAFCFCSCPRRGTSK